MARSQIRAADALRKARERQRELDREDDDRRDAARKRIAEASATAMVALGRHVEAEEALETATAEVGSAVRALLAEDVDVERAAALLDLDVAEVRRFAKAGAAAASAEVGGADKASGAATVTPMSGRGAQKPPPAAASVGEERADAERRTG